jgi:hypothetical protein
MKRCFAQTASAVAAAVLFAMSAQAQNTGPSSAYAPLKDGQTIVLKGGAMVPFFWWAHDKSSPQEYDIYGLTARSSEREVRAAAAQCTHADPKNIEVISYSGDPLKVLLSARVADADDTSPSMIAMCW